MSFDPENIPLIPTDWFSTDVSYAGRGRAEFHDPAGAVEGEARVRVEEGGASRIELAVERVVSEQPLRMGLMELFSSQKPVERGGTIGLSGGGEPPNPCTKLTVAAPQGEFSAAGDPFYSQVSSSLRAIRGV